MNVSLIITTYNRPDALAAVLETVRLQSRFPDETIIVDDGSDDRTKVVIDRFYRSIPALRRLWQENRGFRPARMRNWGIAEAEGEYLIFIDGDMLLHRQFVADHATSAQPRHYIQGVRIPLSERATDAYLRHPFAIRPQHIASVEKIKYLIRSPWLSKLFTHKPHAKLTRIHSCNQSFWRDDLLEVNGFEESLSGFGGEDIDLCSRLVDVGVLQLRPRFLAAAFHLHHPRTANWSKFRRIKHDSPRATLGVDQHLPAILPFVPAQGRPADKRQSSPKRRAA